jgi:hypothetical protein
MINSKIEKYCVQIKWYNTEPYTGNWKGHNAFVDGKPVMGWTVSYAEFKTEKELIFFIKEELNKGYTLWQPPWYEKEEVIDGHFDIMGYEREYIRNYRKKYNIK